MRLQVLEAQQNKASSLNGTDRSDPGALGLFGKLLGSDKAWGAA